MFTNKNLKKRLKALEKLRKEKIKKYQLEYEKVLRSYRFLISRIYNKKSKARLNSQIDKYKWIHNLELQNINEDILKIKNFMKLNNKILKSNNKKDN